MDEKQVNLIARKFGQTLCVAGMKMLQSAFKLNPVKVSEQEIRLFLLDLFKEVPNLQLRFFDEYYFLLPIEDWKNIIEFDWSNDETWMPERFDCDNMAFAFAGRMSEIYGINSAPPIMGEVWNKDTGTLIGGHYWNGIIAKTSTGFKLYYFEPQNDLLLPYESGQSMILGNWKYSKPKTFTLF